MKTRWNGCMLVLATLLAFPSLFAQTSDGTLAHEQKISDTVGGFLSTLANSDFFGSSLTQLGDIDGDLDGRQEIAVGAFGDDAGGGSNGAVYILSLNSDGTVYAGFTEQKTVGTASQSFGIGVARVEVGNGGLPELAVGANGDDTGGNDRGAVHLFSLNAAGIDTLIDTVDSSDIAGLENDDLFGSSVTSLGNLDGSGGVEIAVGAPGDDDGGGDRGAIWILSLNTDGTFNSVLQKISDTATGGAIGGLTDGGNLGQAVAWLGDLGAGDGAIAGGAFRDDTGGTARGAVWTLFVNADGTLNSRQQIADGTGGFGGSLDDSDLFGNSVANLGDLDGDGVIDLGVGAPNDDDGVANAGALWILFMNTDGSVNSEQKISSLEGGLVETLGGTDSFGWSVGALDDLDGNGVQDLVVGARRDDDGGSNRGAAYVLFLNALPTCDAGPSVPI